MHVLPPRFVRSFASLLCLLGLASAGRADFFDRAGTFTPKASYTETYAQSVKANIIPGDPGDPDDPSDDTPAEIEYYTAYTYSATIVVQASLAGFDRTKLVADMPLSLTVGEYTFNGALSAEDIAARKAVFTTADSDPGPPATRSSEQVVVTWTETTISLTVNLGAAGVDSYESGVRLPALSGEDGTAADGTDVSLTLADVTSGRSLFGKRTERYSTVKKFIPVPSEPGEPPNPPDELDFDLTSMTAAGAADYTPPPLTFLTPQDKSISYLPAVRVALQSDESVQSVWVRVNGSEFVVATGVDEAPGLPWTAQVNLVAGANLIEAKAVDLSGNETAIISRRVSFEPLRSTLVALLTDAAGHPQGRLEIKIAKSRDGKSELVTGSLFLKTGTLSVRGTVNADKTLTLTLKGAQADQFTMTAGLTNDPEPSGEALTRLTGSLAIRGGATLRFIGAHAPFDGKNQLFLALTKGTMLLQPAALIAPANPLPSPLVPPAPGFATLKAGKNGAVRLAGRLADGTPFLYGAKADANLQLGIFLPLNRGQGLLAGAVMVASDGSTLTGELLWEKPAQSRALYKSAFRLLLTVQGGSYTPGTVEKIVDPGAPATYAQHPAIGFESGLATVAGGNLANPISNTNVTLTGAGRVTVTGSNPGRLALSVANASGLVTGSFFDPVSLKKRTIFGVVASGEIGGYFVGKDQVGSLQVMAPAAAQ